MGFHLNDFPIETMTGSNMRSDIFAAPLDEVMASNLRLTGFFAVSIACHSLCYRFRRNNLWNLVSGACQY